MAQESKDKEREVDEDEASDAEASSAGSSETMRAGDDEALVKADADEGDAGHDEAGHDEAGDDEAGDDEGGEGTAAAQLGADRYVLAGFFATGMLGAYVLGRALQSAWISASNKDLFAQRLPALAAVSDDDKGMYGILLGGIISLLVVYRAYKRPDVRTWSDEVAAELAKVVWPSRKEVTSSTFIVIVSSAMATLYLALLDRLWSFITNIVYGDGS
jgi:preprotein translocase subunit SecE